MYTFIRAKWCLLEGNAPRYVCVAVNVLAVLVSAETHFFQGRKLHTQIVLDMYVLRKYDS